MSILTFATLAYVGPGAGLGAVGALFAVIVAVFLGLVGLVMYPVKLLRQWSANRKDSSANSSEQTPAA